MRRVISFLFFFLFAFCVSLAEDVDLHSMTADEISEYVNTAPLEDTIRLAEKYNLPVDQYLMNVYQNNLSEWRAMSDPAIFLSYCLSRTVMHERNLMDYLSLMDITNCSVIDSYDELSFEELSFLRDQIMLEIISRDEWQEVNVPAGTYKVGEHIPAGHWLITCAQESYCFIDVGSELESNLKEIKTRSEGYYHIALTGVSTSSYARGNPSYVDLVLKEGTYISIEHSYVIFSPYVGYPDFEFTFN